MSSSPASSQKRRRLVASVVVVLVLVVALGAYAFVQLGRFLGREDPLSKADAIFVLAGTQLNRPLEGAELYFEGYAPRLVLSREYLEPSFAIVERRGAPMSTLVERARDVLLKLGVPATALALPDKLHGSTADEAITLRQLAETNRWRTVIVVTSKFHLRRAGFAMRRELSGTGVRVIMRGSRFDNARLETWWRQRSDIRDVVSELPKFAAYALGFGA